MTEKIIEKLEKLLNNTNVTPISWLLGISGTLMARFFLEVISSPTQSGIIASDASTLIHYYLFFVSFALAFMIFIYFFIPRFKEFASRMVVLSFAIILLAPLIDFVLTKGGGVTMTYLFDSWKEMLSSLLHFFGSEANGITLGIRIEAGLIIAAIFALIWKVEKSFLKALLGGALLYVLIFAFVSMPGLISLGNLEPLSFIANSIADSATFPNNLHGTLLYSSGTRALEVGFNFLMSKIWFLIAAILACVWFFITKKEKAVKVFGNSRPERVAFHFFVIAAGLGLARVISPVASLNWNDLLSIIILFIAFYFSWMFEVAVNDVADKDIDEVSNKNRPLISGNLTETETKQTAVMFLAASLIAGFIAGYYAFFFLLAFTAIYYIYSMPPTRYKRIPFFSSFLIALCCLAEFMAGFFLISNSKMVSTLPTRAIVAIVVLVFLWSHIRDMKDIEGDAKAGIPTVPVIFGKWGGVVVGILASLNYLLIPLFLQMNILFAPAIPAAAATYYFVNKKPYTEWPLFATYFFFIAISLLILKPLLF